MKEIVELIAKALVDKPEEVVLTETLREDSILIELSVAESDMGKIIGRSGKIAKAIRSIVKAATSKIVDRLLQDYRVLQQPFCFNIVK